MRPVLSGFWKHHEIADGTYDFADLCDINALLDYQDEVKAELRAKQNG